MTDLHPNFEELTNRALRLMESPWQDASHFDSIIRIAHYPSFEPMVVWDAAIDRNSPDGSAYVCELTWDRPADLERFVNPSKSVEHPFKLNSSPLLYRRRGRMPDSAILRQLGKIDFSAFDDSITGGAISTDGDHFYVDIHTGSGTSNFHWESSAVPPQWTDLVEWTRATTEIMIGAVATSRAEALMYGTSKFADG